MDAATDEITEHTKEYWDAFYAKMAFVDASTFCRYVGESSYFRPHVIDLGCGNGRDSFAFAKHAEAVIGVDQSAVAIERSMQIVREKGPESLSFARSELEDTARLGEIIASIKPKASKGLLFYCRFVLHAITEEAQEALITVIANNMGPQDIFAAEFRTAKDETKDHVHGDHYRRYQDSSALAKQLASRWGLKVVVYQEGNGFSPYKGEDPELCRLVAKVA